MTRRDTMQSMHEPFGDPFYFGPELMSERFREDAEHRNKSGYGGQTYKDVLNEFAQAEQDVRVAPYLACTFPVADVAQLLTLEPRHQNQLLTVKSGKEAFHQGHGAVPLCPRRQAHTYRGIIRRR